MIDLQSGAAVGTAADVMDGESDAVHDVLRRTDVWFAYKVAALDREAKELAEAHARMGQPRHDIPRDAPLEMEVMLEQHAKEVLWNWADRVRRKMQGAISTETERIESGIAQAREAVANAVAARRSMDRQRELISQEVALSSTIVVEPRTNGKHAAVGDGPTTIEYERHLPNLWFVPLVMLLVLADFFANVPVFVELFPANHVVDAAFARWEAGLLEDDLPSWFGVAHLFKRVSVYPEPSILALSVVIFFLFLGHHLGGSLRTLVVLWKHRIESAVNSVGRTWRQAGWPAALSLLGIGLTMFVLFQARQQVLPMAQDRLDSAQGELTRVQGEIAARQESGRAVSPDLVTGLIDAQDNVGTRRERVDYAEAISGMNLPIALLNGVLIIAAIVVGYLREHGSVALRPETVDDGEERARRRLDEARDRIGRMNDEMDRLRGSFVGRREAAHDAMRAVGGSVLRVQHLVEADLLRDWYGKSERLRRAVPLFRTENARLRGLDVEDILAFRQPHQMTLPTPDMLPIALERPASLAAFEREFQSLQARLDELDHESSVEAVPFVGIRAQAHFAPEPSFPRGN